MGEGQEGGQGLDKLGVRMLLEYPGLTIAGGLALAIAIGIGAGCACSGNGLPRRCPRHTRTFGRS
jgi:hypothetical protein